MICVADFLNTLFRNILEKPVAANRYVYKYNISRNNFAYYINTNHPMSQNIADGLYKIAIDTIKEEPEKEATIIDYFSSFLTIKEKDPLSDCEIIRAAIAKFTATSNKKRKNKLKIIGYQDIKKMGKDIQEFVSQAIELDNDTIEDLTDEHEGNMEQWVELASKLPETFRYLFDNNEMIGIWGFKPLFDEDFQRAKNGKLFDGELNLSMMPMLITGTYNIYFVNICLKERYRGTKALKILLDSIADALVILAKRDIFINEICTQAYSLDGERLCKSLGLKYHTKHVDCGNIYCGTIKDLLEQPFCRNFYTLKNLYSNKIINS
jgi:hypothetical protein